MPHQIGCAPSSHGASAKHYLIFFITGNPGFIAYYRTFLTTLGHILSTVSSKDDKSSPAFHILGQSLPGFEDEDDSVGEHPGPYGLHETIEQSFNLLVAQRVSTGDHKGDYYDGIILIGHSVGAFILLELLRKLRQKSLSESIKVKAGILLFPTVMNLAQSPNGQIGAVLRIPYLPRVFSFLVMGIFWPLPRSIINWLVRTVTGMPEDAADITSKLFVCKRALWQALHLARDEMVMISEDRWDEDIWGAERPTSDSSKAIPKLIFYFGQKDRWVADHTRDFLIAARGSVEGQNSSKPRMIIDQGGVPHAFCIKHGEIIAEKVKVWVEEIVNAD